jgi:large subunit ribosomal protein L23
MDILKKPIITEKMTGKSEKLGQYGFIVERKAKKPEIKKAIEKMYEVNVATISTMIYGGKPKARFVKGVSREGKTAGYKKAVVTLKDGQTIDFFQNI